MAKQLLNIGSSANDGTGDTIRVGGDKINDNFNEIYSGTYRWLTKTSAYTAVAGDKLLVDVSSAAITITLPSSANAGEEVTIIDAKGNAATNNITIARNGLKIKGTTSNVVLSTNYAVRSYVYESATAGWVDNNDSGVSAALNDITNVTITSNSAGELLKWNGSAWINNTLVEAGVAALTGSTNNTVVTVTGAHLIQGEGNLTFDGSTLAVTGAATISTTLGVTGVTTLSEDVTFTGAANNVVWDKSDNALEFADSAKANFGAGTDLSIHHDGSNSYIVENGTGNLYIRASDWIYFQNSAGTETKLTLNTDGALHAYFDNSVKLSTTAAGITVTGAITTAGLTTTGAFTSIGIDDNADAVAITITSDEKVGIQETTPLGYLHVKKGDSSVSAVNVDHDLLVLESNGTGGMSILTEAANAGRIAFGDVGDPDIGIIGYHHNGNSMRFTVNAAEKMRIHSGGVVSFNDGIELGSGLDATAANTLDDYEEGTFTATLLGTTSNPSSAVSVTSYYTKIGNLVYIAVAFNGSGSGVDTTGAVGMPHVGGIPFMSLGNPGGFASGNVQFSGSRFTHSGEINPYVVNSSVSFYQSHSGGNWSGVAHSAGSGAWLIMSCHYMSAV